MGKYERAVDHARERERDMGWMDAPRSPEEPQSLSEWLEAMSEKEFYEDFTEIAILAEMGINADTNQMMGTTKRIKRWLAACAEAREEYETSYTPSFQAAACLIVDVMLNSARNYKEKRQ